MNVLKSGPFDGLPFNVPAEHFMGCKGSKVAHRAVGTICKLPQFICRTYGTTGLLGDRSFTNMLCRWHNWKRNLPTHAGL